MCRTLLTVSNTGETSSPHISIIWSQKAVQAWPHSHHSDIQISTTENILDTNIERNCALNFSYLYIMLHVSPMDTVLVCVDTDHSYLKMLVTCEEVSQDTSLYQHFLTTLSLQALQTQIVGDQGLR